MTAAFQQHIRQSLLAFIGMFVIVAHSPAAVVHPMDPLTEDEILGAVGGGGAAAGFADEEAAGTDVPGISSIKQPGRIVSKLNGCRIF